MPSDDLLRESLNRLVPHGQPADVDDVWARVPARAEEVLRRRRIVLGVVLGVLVVASIIGSAFAQRREEHGNLSPTPAVTTRPATTTATTGAPATTAAVTPSTASLETLPASAQTADTVLGDGNVVFMCRYSFGYARFGANASSIAFLNGEASLPGWTSSLVPGSDKDTTQRSIIFKSSAETVVVVATAQPDASGSRCHAEREPTEPTTIARGP
jgi:hypothetical protein